MINIAFHRNVCYIISREELFSCLGQRQIFLRKMRCLNPHTIILSIDVTELEKKYSKKRKIKAKSKENNF